MIARLHHIGVGVKDLRATRLVCQDVLGLQYLDQASWPGLEAALFKIGDVILELIEPSDAELPVGKSLLKLVRERGGGVHHLCLEVSDIAQTVRALKARGVQTMTEAPQLTAGGQVIWLAEGFLEGLMIEICEEGFIVRSD